MKILLVELWGLGDATFMTTALRPLLEAKISVTILCKPATAALLQPGYPQINFLTFDAPWTAFRGKYQLWSWPWKKLLDLVRTCRRARFDAAASVRNDPRDHLLMFLAGASQRVGFPRTGSGLFLTRRLLAPPTAHRVELWRLVGGSLLGKSLAQATPFLDANAYRPFRKGLPRENSKPVIALHCGARIAVRRWPEASFARIIQLLRQEFDFHLALFPDVDSYGRGLTPLADSCHDGLSIPQLVADLAACDLLLCNDSGPGHIASALDRPVLAIFGPTNPDWFRPYGDKNHVVIRDICPFRPCFDNCHFPEPICLTQLQVDETWPEIRDWFRRQLTLLSSRA